MKWLHTTLMVIISFILTACLGSMETISDDATEISTPAIKKSTPYEHVNIPPTQEVEEDSGFSDLVQKGPVSECTLVSSPMDSSASENSIFAISENDWVLGPDDAAVTLIEYGDFQ
jgi:hypothetical protein